MEDNLEIQKTYQYGIFSSFKGNRAINRLNVERLKRSISEDNLLPYRPIIVDSEMVIINGQHRLQAAKELEIPIYFLINPKSNYKQATMLNTNCSNWGH